MIALTTPTGNIGSKVLRLLAKSTDQPIRVLARHPDKIPAPLRARVQVVEGSMEDPGALRRLLDQADALFWCQPDPAGADDYIGAYEALAQLGAEAIRSTGVARVVAVSATGEPGDVPAGPITGLHRMESILSRTDASVRFLRCGSFYENLLWQWEPITKEGFFTDPVSGDVPGPQVASADIARVAADWLRSANWDGRESIALVGPEDLTYDEMASMLSASLGKPVRFQASPPQAYVTALQSVGHSERAAQGLVDMFAYLTNHYRSPADADRSLTPTSFSDWLESQPWR
ncbi:MAG: NAD(P)H-binding protein [Opitutales bacterium]|nr:NAD(P)H-binding protein [Opitutales bacterium]